MKLSNLQNISTIQNYTMHFYTFKCFVYVCICLYIYSNIYVMQTTRMRFEDIHQHLCVHLYVHLVMKGSSGRGGRQARRLLAVVC